MTQQSPSATPTLCDPQEIGRALELLFRSGDVAELRMPVHPKKTIAGFFNDRQKLAQAAERWSGTVPAVYVTLNPVNPALLARYCNRVESWAKDLTTDDDILERNWLLMDADPVRPSGISSTDEEHEAALAFVKMIRDALRTEGWPDPIVADSGNGGHLLYPIKEPADDKGLIRKVLQATAQRFDSLTVKIDRGVHNQARISKLYGTMACKGDNTPERPHRIAHILEAPDTLAPVSHDLLQAMADSLPAPKARSKPTPKVVGTTDDDTTRAAKALARLAPWRVDDYQAWINVGMALKQLSEPGFGLWDQWSRGSSKYDERAMRAKWDSFEAGKGITLGSLFHWAREDDPGGDDSDPDFDYGLPPDPCANLSRIGQAPPPTNSPAQLPGQPVAPQPAPPQQPAKARQRPLINLANLFQHQRMAQYEQVLLDVNNPPFLFARSGALVSVRTDENRRPRIENVTKERLGDILCHHAAFAFVRMNDKGETTTTPTEPTQRDLSEYLTRDHRRFPALEAIIQAPTLRPDGSIIGEPGYDPATKLYYLPDPALVLPPIPEQPTQEQARESAALLQEAIGEFPYALDSRGCDSSRANAVGMLVTPIVRPAIKGHIPAPAIDGTQQGLGKGLLCNTAAIIATGQQAHMMNAPKNDEEMAKTLTSLLVAGKTFVILDNITGLFDSPQLATFLTTDTWTQRLLGGNDMVTVAQRACVFLNGNNLSLGGDLPRRCYWIRLDAKMARPWQRTGFTHTDLQGWVTERRGELLAAILTMARAWYVAGRPAPTDDIPGMGTFSTWAQTIGGILNYAGITGFLQNVNEMYDRLDSETTEWQGFLESWHDLYSDKDMVVAELVPALQPQFDPLGLDNVPGGELYASLPADLARAIAKGRTNTTTIGKVFGARDGRVYPNGYRLEHGHPDRHGKRQTWRVVFVGNAGDAGNAGIVHAQSMNERLSTQPTAHVQPGSDTTRITRVTRGDEGGACVEGHGTGHNGSRGGGAGVGDPPGIPLGKAKVDRTRLQEGLDQGLSKKEALERARVRAEAPEGVARHEDDWVVIDA